MRNVLIVGAGKLGKGFLGEVFDAAKDWKVSFLDKDPRVIENLKKPEGYKVMCCREDRTDHRVITDYEAFLVLVPIVAGGMIEESAQALAALKSGAVAISTSRESLWYGLTEK